MSEQLLTVSQAAKRYSVSELTIRKWLRHGLIACTRVGPHGLIRIRAEDMENPNFSAPPVRGIVAKKRAEAAARQARAAERGAQVASFSSKLKP